MSNIAQALALGAQHQQAGELERARQIYHQVLQAEPGNTQALHQLGMTAIEAGRPDDAIAWLRQAVALDPLNSVFHGRLGVALVHASRWQDARLAFERAIGCDPANCESQYNLGVALENLDMVDEAMAQYRHCLQACPPSAATHNNLGNLLRARGKLDEALVHLEQAVRLRPDFPEAHSNRGLVLLGQGRLAEGWSEYEWRLRWPKVRKVSYSEPFWDGTSTGDKVLLVYAEQGLGDTLQFIRYLPLVEERCPKLLVAIQPPLVPILAQSGFSGLVARRPPPPGFDLQISILSLPGVFKTMLDDIPARVPYLHAREDLIAYWQRQLSGSARLKVGIVWLGSPTYAEDRYRSIGLSWFTILAEVPGVQLYSLQKSRGREQLHMMDGRMSIIDLGSRIDNEAGAFMDTAAIMKNLDLVITSDTASAHLAGALGVPVWVALPLVPDWRWLMQGEACPWYPTMRLFRQTKWGDWQPVFERMAAELRLMV
ncbi:MAG TPA: tetratricopeptide repeat-containing glycosyltransferase family protein [Pirellulales bacterium]|nr:tetratricopeptide repeat-containing glycosyltransferase family protein [Pirellulales bacterium]